ncbi:MAG: hypothetical protein KIS76_04020 [Pyrinomonadaceae bacterium]|nr:hypothetical protein [Pyrinomonadaceae bacterium]
MEITMMYSYEDERAELLHRCKHCGYKPQFLEEEDTPAAVVCSNTNCPEMPHIFGEFGDTDSKIIALWNAQHPDH